MSMGRAWSPAPPGEALADALEAARAHAPYLARLMRRRPDLLEDDREGWPGRLIARAMAAAGAIAADPPSMAEGMTALRRAKDAVHLALAALDLSRTWPLGAITGALTDFADASLAAAVSLAARVSEERGDMARQEGDAGPIPGLAIIAMGKMGARELNYSSDIDFSVFYEPAVLPIRSSREPSVVVVRLVAQIVRALEEVTADGYVFRTDLRLRPDPGATAVAVSLRSAENYYQHLGQNWERAAFIKARAVAADQARAQAFVESLLPFVWRRHLDYAAIDDIRSIKRQILAVNSGGALDEPDVDVKLGRGGIRDIELFAQTQQLILGGRHAQLRAPTTLGALEALAGHGAITPSDCAALSEAYIFLRDVEHRIQMMEDEQTQATPADPAARARLAALCGYDALSPFDAALAERRARVAAIDFSLFGRDASLADPLGSLVFTGVEDHPETLRTLGALGFSQPGAVSQTIRGWHHGRIRAMRAERARELLTTLTPSLLRALAQSGAPDAAFARFAAFFAGLVGGVQVLSLFAAQPRLMDALARAFGLAPRLADALARRPALIDAMIDPDFTAPLADARHGRREQDLRARLASERSFEGALNAARRFHREEAFRIGMQVLDGRADGAVAGAAYADLAEGCVRALADAALAETRRRYGPAPGAFAVLALGKFGGRELSEDSDLDIMIVFDADDAGAGEYFTRFTQRLISALSAPTEEGLLYEIDMQLRPSGSKGPVAVRLSSFERYYGEEAWTWELLALTRLRAVAGDARLGARAEALAAATLARTRVGAAVLADAAEMRARMERERAGRGLWDLKLAPGGFVDIEFIAQAMHVAHSLRAPANTGDALDALARAGVLSQEDHALLSAAWRRASDLQQLLRICVDGEFDAAKAPEVLVQRLAQAGDAASLEQLEAILTGERAAVRAAFKRLIGPL